MFSRVNKKWTRLDECLSPRMYPAIAPLYMGTRDSKELRYRAVMFGGGQNRPIKDTDENSIVWVRTLLLLDHSTAVAACSLLIFGNIR